MALYSVQSNLLMWTSRLSSSPCDEHQSSYPRPAKLFGAVNFSVFFKELYKRNIQELISEFDSDQ